MTSRRIVFCFALWLSLLTGGRARATEVPCSEVIAIVDRHITRNVKPDVSEIAKKLKTQIGWVETCLQAYGRRYRRPGLQSDAGREEVLEGHDTGKDEETEDLDDPDEPAVH